MNRYFIENDQKKIHITEWGNSSDPVIFCVHGLGSTSLSFIEIAEELKGNFRIIAVDMPGHGKTDAFDTAEQYEMPSLVKWLNTILEKLNVKKFYFLSHSWGSFVSLYYLVDHPQRVLGTILIDGGYQTKRLQQQSMEEEVAFYEDDFEDYVDTWGEFLEEAVYGGVSRTSALLNMAGEDLALQKNNKFHWHARGKTAGNIIKAMYKHETADIYEELPAEIILLRATVPESQEKYRAKTSEQFKAETGGTVKVVAGASHMLHWDRPDIVIQEILENWG